MQQTVVFAPAQIKQNVVGQLSPFHTERHNINDLINLLACLVIQK